MKVRLAVPLLAILMLTACASRTPTPGTPPVPVTPMEQFAVTNAQVTTINQAIEQGAVQLNTAGVLSTDVTALITTWCFRVADFDSQVTVIVQSTDSATTKGTKIRALIAGLKSSAAGLISSGALGVKNPTSKQTILADVNSILSLTDTILSELQMGGIIQ